MVSVLQSGTDTGFLALPYSAKAAQLHSEHIGGSGSHSPRIAALGQHRKRLQLRKRRYEQL
jgi:hypothetical protein